MKNKFIVTEDVSARGKKEGGQLIKLIGELPFSIGSSGGSFPLVRLSQRRYTGGSKRRCPKNYQFQIDGFGFSFDKDYFFVFDFPEDKYKKAGTEFSCLGNPCLARHKDYFFRIAF